MNSRVKCELLNVRKTPEKTDNVVDVITKGTEVLIIEDANGWLRIHGDNLDGYVMAEFVAIEAEPEPAAAAKSEETDPAAGQEPEKPKKNRKKGGEKDEQTGAAE